MALDFQNVDVRFLRDGLDTRTQKKLVVPGKWLKLQNVRLAPDDSPQLRDGVTLVTGAVSGNGLATRDNQLLAITGQTARTILTSNTTPATVSGEIGYCDVEAEPLMVSQDNKLLHDCAYANGYVCYVWEDTSPAGASLSLIHEATGAVLQSNVLLRVNAVAPRVVAVGNFFLIFYFDGPNAQLVGRVINTASPSTLSAEVNLITSLNLRMPMDAAPAFTGNSTACVYYGWADGVTSTRAIFVSVVANLPAINSGPTNITTEVALPVATLSGVAVKKFPVTPGIDVVGLFASSTGATALSGVCATTVDAACVVQTPATLIDATVNPTAGQVHLTATEATSGTGLSVYVDQISNYNTARLNQIRWVTVTNILGITTAAAALVNSNSFRVNAAEASGPQGPWIAGKAFTLGARLFLPVSIQESWNITPVTNVNTNNAQNTLYMLDALTGVCVARALTGAYAANATTGVRSPCSTPALADGVSFAMLAPWVSRVVLVAGVNVSPVGISRVTWTPRVSRPAIASQIGPVTELAGGSLTQFDGRAVAEAAFHLYPEGYSCVMNGAAGAVTAGVHQVVVVYEWTDNAGQRHQSAPGLPVSVTAVGAPQRVVVAIPTLQLQQRPGMTCACYMTAAGGTIFYRGSAAATANSTAATNVGYLFQEADAALIQNEALYTQPLQPASTLANTAPPPCDALAVFDNRLWVNATDDQGAFYFSQRTSRATGLRWADALRGTVDVKAGGIVAMSALDEKLILLCENGIRVITGNGPNAAGLNSGYSDPIEVQSDGGCVEARSVLSMPMGIIFKSPKGWRLLGRDLMVRDIGDGVTEFDAQDVTSAVLIGDKEECRFTTSNGAQLTYCYRGSGQWSYFYYGVNYSPGQTYNPLCAVWWPAMKAATANPSGYNPDGFGYVTIDGGNGIHRDADSQFDVIGSADAVPIPKFLTTSWLSLASIGGFQRVRWLYLTSTCRAEGGIGNVIDSTIALGLAFDNVELDVPSQANNYTVSPTMTTVATSAVRGTGVVDMRHKLRVQKCKAVQLTISEEGYTTACLTGFQALTLNVGVKRGTKKLPAGQGVG